MVFRCIAPQWLKDLNYKPVLEGEFTREELDKFNAEGYNIYFLPNYPSQYESGRIIDGSHIDQFQFVFVDMDLKEGKYQSKEEFLNLLFESGIQPTAVNDSGNGIHAFWQIADLDAMSFLKFQRRLCRKFSTDEAVAKIYQLMRVPNTMNTKKERDFKSCVSLHTSDALYTSEELDKLLPIISPSDDEYCKQHFDKTYNLDRKNVVINDRLPTKFGDLIRSSEEVKDIWAGRYDDRSKADFRLGHLMFANDFTKEEALSVLVNSPKASERGPVHRMSYAEGIVEKIWTFEITKSSELSYSVKDILQKSGKSTKGKRFPCHTYIDATEYGFRLGQVIGLVAGSGVGKTSFSLNMFKWFVERNPTYDHFFVPLEQPATEIAERWAKMCSNDRLHEKVQVISNYAEDGSFRHLSLTDIKDYILKWKADTGREVGCVVIDHIGALKKTGKDGENQGLMDICHQMKAFAIETNTLLVMQSQAPREKAGIGDLELNKDAAYGTVFFESYTDYLVSIWQPLKRCYSSPECPTVTAYKFCKIRHKKQGFDKIQEDVCYRLFFDPEKEHFRELTQIEEKAFDFWNQQATNIRKRDRKTDLVPYKSMPWVKHNE